MSYIAAWSYQRKSGKRRAVAFAEGMLGMYAMPVYKQLEPLDINPHGWGLDLVACCRPLIAGG